MCLAIPGQIVEIGQKEPLARVNVCGVTRNVNIGLLDDGAVAPGDWILIHVGFALSKIDEGQAQDQLRMLRAMGEDGLAPQALREIHPRYRTPATTPWSCGRGTSTRNGSPGAWPPSRRPCPTTWR